MACPMMERKNVYPLHSGTVGRYRPEYRHQCQDNLWRLFWVTTGKAGNANLPPIICGEHGDKMAVKDTAIVHTIVTVAYF